MDKEKHLKYLKYQAEYYAKNKEYIDLRNHLKLQDPENYKKHLEYYRNIYYKKKYKIDHSKNKPIEIECNIIVQFL
jgi:hypothetical protein